jgi:hypothetical protein
VDARGAVVVSGTRLVTKGTVVVRSIRELPISKFVVVGVVTAIVVGIRVCVRIIEGAATAAVTTALAL